MLIFIYNIYIIVNVGLFIKMIFTIRGNDAIIV